VVAGVSVGVLFMLYRGLNGFRRDAVEPVIDVTGVISALAAGDMQVAARHGDRQDEVGAMARAIEVFRANALAAEEARAQADALKAEQARILAAAAVQQQQVVDTLAERLKSMAGGRLDCSINEFFPDEYKRLRMDFNAAVTELSGALEDIRISSHNVASAAVQLGEGASDISRRAEHQAATLEETAAAHDQITATVTTTLSVARETAEMVAFAQERAQSSKGVVGEAVGAIRAIEQSSRQISQIIGVIDEIAFQTNLLALNAGVEAARAGDAGRGFAVVAMEVRALAQRSAEAAKEIRGLINDAERSVGEGVRLVDATGTALNEIVDEVAEIAGRVRHIASSAQEQSVALEEVNRAISALDTVTQQNAAVAEESATACHSLQDEADRLVSLVGRFVTASSAQTAAQFGSGSLSSAA
jgi:methyl-accepting chemotaxis protein